MKFCSQRAIYFPQNVCSRFACLRYWFCRCCGPNVSKRKPAYKHKLGLWKTGKVTTHEGITHQRQLGYQSDEQRRKERDDGVSCFLWICILVVRKLIIVAVSPSYVHTHRHTHWQKHTSAWQFPGELATLDWWCRHSSICFVISLSLYPSLYLLSPF